MSTIFGVVKNEYQYAIKPKYSELDGTLFNDINPWNPLEPEYFENVFIRFNGSGGRWLNPIADLLPDDTKVWALDNTPQGIYTIGDIKKEIK